MCYAECTGVRTLGDSRTKAILPIEFPGKVMSSGGGAVKMTVGQLCNCKVCERNIFDEFKK